jgi:hypothetical protein
MANSLKSAIDRWSTEAVENAARRVILLAVAVGLVVLGIVLIATAGDTNTYHVFSCDSTGNCGWSTQHPSFFAVIGKFGGMFAIAIGGLMLLSFGVKMYKKMTTGTSPAVGGVSGTGGAPFTSGVVPPTPPVAPPPPPVVFTPPMPTGGGVGPVGPVGPPPVTPAPVTPTAGVPPAPRLKGKLAK